MLSSRPIHFVADTPEALQYQQTTSDKKLFNRKKSAKREIERSQQCMKAAHKPQRKQLAKAGRQTPPSQKTMGHDQRGTGNVRVKLGWARGCVTAAAARAVWSDSVK